MPMWNEQHVKMKHKYIDGSNIPIDLPCIDTVNAKGCNLFSLVCRCNVRMCFFIFPKWICLFPLKEGILCGRIKCNTERRKNFCSEPNGSIMLKLCFDPQRCTHILKKHNCVLLHSLRSLTRSHLTESLKNTRPIRLCSTSRLVKELQCLWRADSVWASLLLDATGVLVMLHIC